MSPGKWVFAAGLVLALFGLGLVALERLGVQWGRLPFDFQWRGKNWVISSPLASSVLVSLLLTLLLNLLSRK